MSAGSPAQGHIFISYAHKDRALVESAVAALEQAGLTVWWDDKMRGIRWDTELQEKLERSSRVVAFLTENAVDTTFDYVYTEVKHGREESKLVPLRIGQFRMPLAFDGLIGRIQTYFFPDPGDVVGSDAFAKLCRILGGVADADGSGPAQKDADQRLAAWLRSKPALEDMAFAIALAVLEGSPMSVIQRAAGDLQRFIKDALATPAATPAATPGTPPGAARSGIDMDGAFRSVKDRLQSVEAETFTEMHPRLQVARECCRFRDTERSAALTAYVWQQLDQLHDTVVRWLDHLATTLNVDGRQRLGVALGLLGQTEFFSIYDQLLRRWVQDEHGGRRDLADIAFAVASFDQAVAEAIRRIVTDWSHPSSRSEQLKAAVVIACGYTGMRIPNLSIETLKRVSAAEATDLGLVKRMKDAIDDLIKSAVQTGDNSLLNLPQLVKDLASWVQGPETGEIDRLAMFLLLTTLEDLPLTKPSGVPGILSVSELTASESNRTRCAEVFCAALEDVGAGELSPRTLATEVLKRWGDLRSKEPGADDAVLPLAQEIWRQAKTQRDRDRIAFIFRRHYTEQELQSPPVQRGAPPGDDDGSD